MAEQNYYDVLGVPPDASEDVITEHWKRLVSYWHPDRNAGPDALARATRLNEAHSILINPVTRNEYDIKLAVGQTVANGSDYDWAPPWTPAPVRYSASQAPRAPAQPPHRPTSAPPPPH